MWHLALKTVAVAAFVAITIFGGANSAVAARSGGRVGGGSFSSFKAPSYSSSSSSFSPSYSGGHSTTIIAPSVGLGMPSFFFPVFPSYGFGYGSPVSSGFVNLILLAFVAFFLVQVVSSFTSRSDDEVEAVGGPASVMKVQVGLLGSARSLQQDLERMARQADTTSPQGLHFILQEIVLSLLRNPSYWIYATSGLKKVKNVDDAENAFNNMQMEERGKFQRETVVNVSGIKKDATSVGGASSSNELIVVTVLVAADGKLEIPQVRSAEDLRQALTILGGVRQEQLMATEILWTPSDENDFYSKDELFMDYPTLVSL